MKGFPLQNLIVMLLALAALSVPLLRLEHPLVGHPPATVATAANAVSVPVLLRLRMVHPPQRLELTVEGLPVPLLGTGLERAGEAILSTQTASLELNLKGTWQTGISGTMVELRAAPNGMPEQTQNVWVEAGEADELVRFAWRTPP